MVENKFILAVYETMSGYLTASDCVPGVEDAYAEGGKCDELYKRVYAAERRLEDCLGMFDEDVSEIVRCMTEIQQELCIRMYYYSAKFGLRE